MGRLIGSGTSSALLLISLLLASSGSPGATIAPDDSDLLYTGRWDASTPSQPWCYWIGSSVQANFEGTSLKATFSAGWAGSPDYLRVIIDDDVAGSSKIAVGTSATAYTLATGLSDSVHKLEIVKETDVGDWMLLGFELDAGKSLVAPPARPARKIAFYGDSNLAGYSLESELNSSNQHLRGSYNSLAGIAARMFDAEYQNVSRSGATISGIHDRYDRISYWYASPTWNFADFPADLVVVNLGANDVGSPEVIIKQAYHAFLDDLRLQHPTAHVMLFNSVGWDYEEPANYIHEVIAAHGDPNMTSATFPWVFEQWHGCESDHGGMARYLANHLTAVLGWVPAAQDVMNGYGMDGHVANGGFEEVAPFGGYGWRYFTDAGVARVNSPGQAHGGEHFLQLSNGASSHQPIPASDGEAFSASFWMRGAVAGDQVEVRMDFRDQKMWTLPLQISTETKLLTSDWQHYSMTATAPTGTPRPVYNMRLTFTAVAGDTVQIDDVQVEYSGGSGYCYGDSAASGCPCGALGNPGEGCANSGGAGGATLTGSGSATFGLDTLQLHVAGIPGAKPGLCVKGSWQLGAGLPVGDGLLCTTPQMRSQVIVSDGSGSVLMDNWRGLAFGSYPNASNVGSATNYQWWYRDAANTCSGNGFNFANAWAVTWLP